jgi:hypothetical protein
MLGLLSLVNYARSMSRPAASARPSAPSAHLWCAWIPMGIPIAGVPAWVLQATHRTRVRFSSMLFDPEGIYACEETLPSLSHFCPY